MGHHTNLTLTVMMAIAFLSGLLVEKSVNGCMTTTSTSMTQPPQRAQTGGREEVSKPPSTSSTKKTVENKGQLEETQEKFTTLPPLPTLRSRADMGTMLEQDKGFDYKIGVELGVQRGHYSKEVLAQWNKATEYWLVDLWQQQTNYVDIANVNNDMQNEIYNEALANTKEWSSKIKTCRNYTTECVHRFPDNYFDFIYIDARHDFKGVLVDVDEWWPKLKKGGVFSGHDYLEQRDLVKPIPRQDWTKNYDGTIDTTGTVVRGVVELFFTNSIWGVSEEKLEELRRLIKTPKEERLRNIKLTYKDHIIMSWYCRK